MTPPHSLVATVLHEARHAVVFHAVGAEVQRIEVRPGGTSRVTVRGAAADAAALAVGYLAPLAAGADFEQCATDVEEARALCEDREDLGVEAVLRARDLVQERAEDVARLATALLMRWRPGAERFGMTGDEVREVLGRELP